MAKKKEKKAGKRMKKSEMSERLISLFHTKPNETFSLKQLSSSLNLTTHPLKMLCADIITEMIEDDFLQEVEKGHYKLNDHGLIMTGVFQRKSNGKNSFIPDDGGETIFTDDLELPNMAYAALVRCPYSHAKVLSIDVSEAEKVPGFLGCALPEEAPQAYFNCSGNPPSPLLMADEKVLTTEPLTIGAAWPSSLTAPPQITIITDVTMAAAGIRKGALERMGIGVKCYLGDERAAALAKEKGITRTQAGIRMAAEEHPEALYVFGNAPTALMELCDLIRKEKAHPCGIIAAPVGFVHVCESKHMVKPFSHIPN